MNNLNWQNIQACSWVVIQPFLAGKNNDTFLLWFLELQNNHHMDWDHMDQISQLVLWVEASDRIWKDRPCNLGDICRLHNGWWLDNLHWFHTGQGMDQYIFGSYRLCLKDILDWLYIQVYMLCRDLQSIHQCIGMRLLCFLHCRQHLIHKVMGCKDQFSQ